MATMSTHAAPAPFLHPSPRLVQEARPEVAAAVHVSVSPGMPVLTPPSANSMPTLTREAAAPFPNESAAAAGAMATTQRTAAFVESSPFHRITPNILSPPHSHRGPELPPLVAPPEAVVDASAPQANAKPVEKVSDHSFACFFH